MQRDVNDFQLAILSSKSLRTQQLLPSHFHGNRQYFMDFGF
jgi:hypothetical protein